MAQVGFTEFRNNLASHLDEVERSRAPLLVTRQGKPNMVVISQEEFDGWQETVHLLSNPRNAAWLLESIREADAGELDEQALVEPVGTGEGGGGA